MGAEPGLWSLAMASAAPASNNFLAGVKLHPSPIEAPGKATAMVSLFAKRLISLSVLASR